MEHLPGLLGVGEQQVINSQAGWLPEQTSAEAALRQSEARYCSSFPTMKQGFCLVKKVATAPGELSDYRYVAAKPAFARQTGLHDVLGKTLRQAVPGAEPHIIAAYDGALASGEVCHFEEYVAALDRWIAAEIIPGSPPSHLAVLFGNVSAQHRAKQIVRESAVQQACLRTLSDALQLATDAIAVQGTVTDTAMQYLRAGRCYYCKAEGDTVTINLMVVAEVPTSLVMDDNLKESCLASSILASIGGPAIRNRKLVGNLCLAQSTPREWTAPEVALVQGVAARTRAAVKRAGAEEVLYATKLQVSQVDVPALPALNGVRGHVNYLLVKAISQTRALAYALVPITLTAQGLAQGLRGICRGLAMP